MRRATEAIMLHRKANMKEIAIVRTDTLTDQSIVFNVCVGDEIIATPRKQYEADAIAQLINSLANDPCVREDLFTAFLKQYDPKPDLGAMELPFTVVGEVVQSLARQAVERDNIEFKAMKSFLQSPLFVEDHFWTRFGGPAVDYLEDEAMRAANPCSLETSNVFNITMRADGYALGKVRIGTIDHHAQFIRVRYSEGVQECDGDSDEARSNWDAAVQLYDVRFQTMRLPEHDGEWVCIIHPCGN